MLQKIIDFFKRLFGGGSSTNRTTPKPKPSPPTTTYPSDINLPEADDTDAQDGSEIQPDTAVVVVKTDDPIIADIPEVDVPPVVVEPPIIDVPPVIEDPVVEPDVTIGGGFL